MDTILETLREFQKHHQDLFYNAIYNENLNDRRKYLLEYSKKLITHMLKENNASK